MTQTVVRSQKASFNFFVNLIVMQTFFDKKSFIIISLLYWWNFPGTNGSSLWSRKLAGNQKNRPITCLRCPQTKDKFFASGDESGRVRIWKGENQYSDGHWHSLPIEALEFSLDSTHILSGGGEGVIVKWDVKSMRKLCVVPRIGTNLTNISLSYAKILGKWLPIITFSNVKPQRPFE